MTVNAVAGPGRGRKITLQGKARDCAKSVLAAVKDHGLNWRYNAAYFGKAMRWHMHNIKVGEKELKAEDKALVDRAEGALKENCDGQDCSFVV